MSQVVSSLLDIVLDLDVVIHDLVLESQVLKSLNHLLDFSANFGRVFVLKLLNRCSNTFEIFTQILVNSFTTPVSVSSKELAYVFHVLD